MQFIYKNGIKYLDIKNIIRYTLHRTCLVLSDVAAGIAFNLSYSKDNILLNNIKLRKNIDYYYDDKGQLVFTFLCVKGDQIKLIGFTFDFNEYEVDTKIKVIQDNVF